VSADIISLPKTDAPARPAPLTYPRAKAGVLLVNLGTPDATDYRSMRRYLKEFLSDRRVIETPRLIWWPILNLIILSRRPSAKGKDYDSIWNRELDESPLRTITRGQAEKLTRWLQRGGLGAAGDEIVVEWAMRYGNPAIKKGIESLVSQGCDRFLLVPLYPQYAAATSATVCDKAFDALAGMRFQPTMRVAHPYFRSDAYIAAIAQSIRDEVAKLSFKPEVLLASFHGIPLDYVDKGDPYQAQCIETWQRLRHALGLSANEFRMSFQSRFGPAQWLQPYTDETIKSMAKAGVKSMAVVAPGFSADCLETIEELGGENRHYFLENGGENYAALRCLNESDLGMQVIQDVVARELAGWV
jgi:protoporphyrin/coproporphyrin ferrochelatase